MTAKKKILYVITKSNFGGAQKYVYDLATHLPPENYDVTVVLGGNGALGTMLEEKGIRVLAFSYWQRDIHFFDEIKTFFALIKLFRAEKPHVVHLNSSKIGGLGSLAARIARVPKVIFTAHGWHFNERRSILVRTVTYALSWFTVLFSHITIAVSEFDAAQGNRMPLVGKKVTCIHNGIEPFSLLEKNAARQELAPHALEASLWIGTIAELHNNKGYDTALRAFALLAKERSDVSYVIVGEGDERKNLTTLARQLDITDNVHIVGNPKNARQYLKAFDIFLLNSTKEGLPYVLLEAGFAGLPVVATRVGGIPEIIIDTQTGILVSPRDPSATAQALQTLLENTEKRQICAHALKEHIGREYMLATMQKKTAALY